MLSSVLDVSQMRNSWLCPGDQKKELRIRSGKRGYRYRPNLPSQTLLDADGDAKADCNNHAKSNKDEWYEQTAAAVSQTTRLHLIPATRLLSWILRLDEVDLFVEISLLRLDIFRVRRRRSAIDGISVRLVAVRV